MYALVTSHALHSKSIGNQAMLFAMFVPAWLSCLKDVDHQLGNVTSESRTVVENDLVEKSGMS